MEPTKKPLRPSYKGLWEQAEKEAARYRDYWNTTVKQHDDAIAALTTAYEQIERWKLAVTIEAVIIVALLIARYAR